MMTASGHSVFGPNDLYGPNPVDLYGWGGQDEDLLFAQDASVSGQFAQQWKRRMMAQEAARQEVANSKLRRPLAYRKTFSCTDVKIGDSVLFYKTPNRKSQPNRRGPARVLDIDETGAPARYQSQTFKVAQYYVRRRVDEKEVGNRDGPPGP